MNFNKRNCVLRGKLRHQEEWPGEEPLPWAGLGPHPGQTQPQAEAQLAECSRKPSVQSIRMHPSGPRGSVTLCGKVCFSRCRGIRREQPEETCGVSLLPSAMWERTGSLGGGGVGDVEGAVLITQVTKQCPTSSGSCSYFSSSFRKMLQRRKRLLLQRCWEHFTSKICQKWKPSLSATF